MDATNEKLKERLFELRREYAAGETQLGALEQRTHDLKQTLLRIGGAIQVLEELLNEQESSSQ